MPKVLPAAGKDEAMIVDDAPAFDGKKEMQLKPKRCTADETLNGKKLAWRLLLSVAGGVRPSVSASVPRGVFLLSLLW